MKDKIRLFNTAADTKYIVSDRMHNITPENVLKYSNLPPKKKVVVFTIHKEYQDVSDARKLRVLRTLIDFAIDEIGKIKYK